MKWYEVIWNKTKIMNMWEIVKQAWFWKQTYVWILYKKRVLTQAEVLRQLIFGWGIRLRFYDR